MLVASPLDQTCVSQRPLRAGISANLRYDQASVIRTMELILGLPALLLVRPERPGPLYEPVPEQGTSPLSSPATDPHAPSASSPTPSFINERVADLPPDRGPSGNWNASPAPWPKGQDTQGPILEQIDWQATRRPNLSRQRLEKRSAKITDRGWRRLRQAARPENLTPAPEVTAEGRRALRTERRAGQ